MKQHGFPKVILKPGKERSLLNFHPWVFSGAIDRMEGEAHEGDIVKIVSSGKIFLGIGHFHDGSIKIRVFSFDETEPDENFWKTKILHAVASRKRLGLFNNSENNSFRLVNAEGDGMPGLIVDFYGSIAVLQIHTAGMYRLRNVFTGILKEIFGNRLTTVFDKSKETIAKIFPESKNEFLFGSETETVITENGYRFYVNAAEGQKTGFFIDQRENRKLVQQFSEGATVLNAFSYTGAFSIYALKASAGEVHSVDSSAKSEEWTNKNLELNSLRGNHLFFREDISDYLEKTGVVYDLIILDPPAFAKHRSAIRQAAAAYQKHNFEAIRKIKQGGVLFTFSCSQVIDRKLFGQVVFAAAAKAKRNVKVLYRLSQPPDHPVSIYHPEGEYLKGLALYVE